jgi:hypothetical protein
MQWRIVSFAFSIGQPICEPVWSMTKTISFGATSARRGAGGGCRISVK